ncbi:MAG: hypothetical protein GXO87_04380 [Chlorobi bacterium]|nr:hypothetical protein [Chlorobiota bacterium]
MPKIIKLIIQSSIVKISGSLLNYFAVNFGGALSVLALVAGFGLAALYCFWILADFYSASSGKGSLFFIFVAALV